jgi:PAS domain S-box-containing protein
LASPLFRSYRHQSGALIPLVVDGEVAGTFYLVWWTERRRVDAAEAATLKTIGQQVGLLLRNARLVEQAETGVFRSTVDGRLMECNQAFTRLLGHRGRDETLQYRLWDFWPDPAEAERLRERLAHERRVGNYEARWRRPAGADVTVMMTVTRIGRGEDEHVAGIVHDVSERKRAEDALREREAQLRNLGDNLPDR